MKKHLNLILLILWMIVIFVMSSFDASQSGSQSGFIVSLINKVLRVENVELLGIIIRKLAHLTEYAILGILMINCLKDYKIRKYLLISVILCFLYACTDEFHQTFIPGRSGNIIDVMIDTTGSFIGIIMYYLIFKKWKKLSEKEDLKTV